MKNIRTVIRNSVVLKLVVIAILVLVLLVPVGMIKGVIIDRADLSQFAENEIMQSWGGEQLNAGPILVLPFTVARSLNNRVTAVDSGRLHVLPAELAVSATVEPRILNRGIHEMPVYSSELAISGHFDLAALQKDGIDLADVSWQHAYIAFAIGEPRTISGTPLFRVGGQLLPVTASREQLPVLPTQVTASLEGVTVDAAVQTRLPFDMKLTVNGSKSLRFLPLGDDTRVDVRSSWDSPKFFGGFIPATRSVTDDGFSAQWRISSIGRPVPGYWFNHDVHMAALAASAFGVELYTPVSLYRLILRSSTYAILFIALTFAAYFLFEVLAKLRLHPIQYLLVGFANALFFLLLLSLAEHLGFGPAYIASAAASVGLVSAYSASVLHRRQFALLMLAIMGLLYGFLYLTLRAESYAMLFGALTLWFALAVLMFLTRKIDWYGSFSAREPRPDPGQ